MSKITPKDSELKPVSLFFKSILMLDYKYITLDYERLKILNLVDIFVM